MSRDDRAAGRPKLSARQLEALRVLQNDIEFTMWGGRPHTRLPAGVTMTQVTSLSGRGLIRYVNLEGLRVRLSITPAGRAALDATDRRSAPPEER